MLTRNYRKHFNSPKIFIIYSYLSPTLIVESQCWENSVLVEFDRDITFDRDVTFVSLLFT